MNSRAELEDLFRDLRRLRFTKEKESLRENLLDVLEIAAVAVGAKPAHLNGQGLRSSVLLGELEAIAANYGLESLRTQPIVSRYQRLPRIDPSVQSWMAERDMAAARAAPRVLWIYKDRTLRQRIEAVASADQNLTEVLGYPDCCVRADSESTLRMTEGYVDALGETYKTDDVGKLIELMRRDTKVGVRNVDRLVRSHFDPARRQALPFISFTPCDSCVQSPASPAACIDSEMRQLAHGLSPDFAAEIEMASRPASQARARETVPKVGRNEPCSCGSGKKYKKCHGA